MHSKGDLLLFHDKKDMVWRSSQKSKFLILFSGWSARFRGKLSDEGMVARGMVFDKSNCFFGRTVYNVDPIRREKCVVGEQ